MSDVAEAEPKESHVDEVHSTLPGQKLRKARENRNLEQVDIAKELKLDLRFVKALEEERFNELPQPVYTAGYVRAYSKLVGLVPDEIVSEYSSHQKAAVTSAPEAKKPDDSIPSHYRQVENTLPKSFSVGHSTGEDRKSIKVLVAVLAVAFVLAIAWQLSDQPSSDQTAMPAAAEGEAEQPEINPADPLEGGEASPTVDSQQDQEQTTINLQLPGQTSRGGSAITEPATNSVSTDSGDQVTNELAQNAQKITELSLHYSEDSWVDIRDATGKPIIRKLGIAGKSNTVSGVAPFEVLLGYSPGVKIEHDGKPYDLSAYSEKRVARFVLNSDGGVESSQARLPGQRLERSEAFAIE